MKFPEPLVRLSVAVNKKLGNNKEWSICATLYHKSLQGSFLAFVAVELTDTLFFFDTDHCRKAWVWHTRRK